MAARKKKRTIKKNDKKERAFEKGNEVKGVVFILSGILLLVTLFAGDESLLKRFADGILRGVFGLGAYILPLLLIAVGVMLIARFPKKIHPGRIALLVLLGLSAFGIVHLIFSYFVSVGDSDSAQSFGDALAQGYTTGKKNLGFGAFASLYVYPLTLLVSKVGTFAIFVADILIVSIVLFNLSLKDTSMRVSDTVKKTGERVQTKFREVNERIEARREAFAFEIGDDDDENDDDGEDELDEADETADSGLEVTEVRRRKHPKLEIEEFTVPDDDFDGEYDESEIDEPREFTGNNDGDEIQEPYLTDEAPESDATGEAVTQEDAPSDTVADGDGLYEAAPDENEVKQAEYSENSEQIDTAEQKNVYQTPPFTLLNPPQAKKVGNTDHSAKIEMMESTLESFGITAWVENITVGPAITRYELSIQRGTRVNKILNLADDIALSMAAVGVRIEAPIPGKSAIGIEIPNETVSMVTLREVLESDAFRNHKSPVAVALGKDITGAPIVTDLSKMPHLLIAGQTGSGKSVCINSIITSLLYKASPKEVKLILVDPKKVELNMYNGIPHLMTPVVSDPKKAAGALQFVVREMEKRYEIFARKKVKEIGRYNEVMLEAGEEPMPRIVVIVDELNDLMLVARGEVEDSVMRIAQLARAAGIYLILATQRPSVNVITGVIKANIPTRIAFAVASAVDSKTILDAGGAEKLVGKGDMLFHLNGESKPTRVQGAFIGEQEIEKVVEFIKNKNDEAKYIGEEQLVMREIKPTHGNDRDSLEDDGDDGEDELFPAAVEFAIECGNISISALQRRFKIGYARAGRLIDAMELRRIIEASQGAKPRQVLMTREEFWAMYDEKIET